MTMTFKTLLATVTFGLSLSFAAVPVLADGNGITGFRAGQGHHAGLTLLDGQNTMTATQRGAHNRLAVAQFGFGNEATLAQDGVGNEADLTQDGIGNEATVTQGGVGYAAGAYEGGNRGVAFVDRE
jgi:minor curlin subunit